VGVITAHLADRWPDAVVELDHCDAYQLLVATILSAQSTDKMINTITPAVFEAYPGPAALAQANPVELEQMIFRSGFYRNKAKHLIEMARAVVERHGGAIPETMEELCALPGVARKTANVVLGCALGRNVGFIVDTHVARVAGRLGFTAEHDPVKIEQDMMRAVPQDQWTKVANRLIWHGRRVCHAKQPDCDHCVLAPVCPSAALFKLPPATPNGAKAKPAPEPRAKPKLKLKRRPKARAKPAAKPTAKRATGAGAVRR
jgi:endonuclease-3